MNIFDQESSKFLRAKRLLEDDLTDLEKRWKHFLLDEEEIGIPIIDPALPRWYRRVNPSESVIKKEFRHLASLKKLAVMGPLLKEHEKFRLKKTVRLAILTYVLPDGLGDWVSAISAADILQKKLVDVEIELFFIHEQSLPPCSKYKVFASHQITPDWIQELEKKDLVIILPTYLEVSLTNTILIGEYGFLGSKHFHPQSGNFSMGLNPLELGVKVAKSNCLSFESEELSFWFQKYPETFVAYLATPFGAKVYFTALMRFLEKSSEDVAIISPDPRWFVLWAQEKTIPTFIGVQKIEIIWKDSIYYTLNFQEKGKVVRILIAQNISKEDMQQLFNRAQDFIGVRGNQSWSEAICSQKPCFYDGREHSKYFWKDMLFLALSILDKNGKGAQFFKLSYEAFAASLPLTDSEWVDDIYFLEKRGWKEIGEDLGNLLHHLELKADFIKFSAIIEKERSLNDTLPLLIQRALNLRFDPELKAREERFLSLFGEGVVPFSTFLKAMRS